MFAVGKSRSARRRLRYRSVLFVLLSTNPTRLDTASPLRLVDAATQAVVDRRVRRVYVCKCFGLKFKPRFRALPLRRSWKSTKDSRGPAESLSRTLLTERSMNINFGALIRFRLRALPGGRPGSKSIMCKRQKRRDRR